MKKLLILLGFLILLGGLLTHKPKCKTSSLAEQINWANCKND